MLLLDHRVMNDSGERAWYARWVFYWAFTGIVDKLPKLSSRVTKSPMAVNSVIVLCAVIAVNSADFTN